jgi:hemerythrin-like domain-containing protein
MPVFIGAAESTFANPIGLLSDCHRRIERFLQTLIAVAARDRGGPLDAEHRRALEAALKYFREAAPRHIADEEEDLFPRVRQLRDTRTEGLEDIERLEAEHKAADRWHREADELGERWLRENFLPPEDTARLKKLLASLSGLYRAHIRLEEDRVFPAARRGLAEAELQAIGRKMALRRGVPFARHLTL